MKYLFRWCCICIFLLNKSRVHRANRCSAQDDVKRRTVWHCVTEVSLGLNSCVSVLTHTQELWVSSFSLFYVHVCVSERDRSSALFSLEDYGLQFQFLSSGNYRRDDIMLFLEQLTFVSPLGSELPQMVLNMAMILLNNNNFRKRYFRCMVV